MAKKKSLSKRVYFRAKICDVCGDGLNFARTLMFWHLKMAKWLKNEFWSKRIYFRAKKCDVCVHWLNFARTL